MSRIDALDDVLEMLIKQAIEDEKKKEENPR